MKNLLTIPFVLIAFVPFDMAYAQSDVAKKKILVDVAHGQRFWHDPSDMSGKDSALIDQKRSEIAIIRTGRYGCRVFAKSLY